MKLEGKNILLISPEPWSDMKVSKHHYAEHLAKKNRVFFLNPPGHTFELQKQSDQLFILDYKPTFKGLKWLPQWISAQLIKLEFNQLQENARLIFDVVWNFDPSRFFNLKKIEALKICHIVDWNQKFQRNLLAKTSDICFSTSSYLQEELGRFNQHSYFINHGYAKRKVVDINLPDQQDQRLKAGYIGNLNIKYLDWSLIHQVVINHPEVLFYMIGPYDLKAARENMKKVHSLENIRFVGKIHSELIPSYLARMDLLFLAYKADEYPKQLANPHKLLEYLGSGKPIVSTFTKAYEDQLSLIAMGEKNKEFLQNFDATCQIENDTAMSLSEMRIKLAESNAYEQQIIKIVTYLNKL